MITDSNVWWLQKKLYIPANQMTGNANVSTTLASFGSGNRPLTAWNSTSTSIQIFAANTNITSHVMMVPYDLDRRKAIRFRIHCSNGTSASANQWKILYGLGNHPTRGLVAGVGTASTTPGATTSFGAAAYADPTLALDTVIPSWTSAGVNFWEITDIGQINAGSSAANPLTDQTYHLSFNISITGTLANTPGLLGLEIQYSVRKTASPVRNRRGGIRLDDHLGTRWQDNRQEGVTVQTG